MPCPSCGADNPDGANFCVSCGHDLRDTAGGAPASPAERRDAGPDDATSVMGAAPTPVPDADDTDDDTEDDESTDEEAEEEAEEVDAAEADATTVVGRPALRDCPACGAPNAPGRTLCGRCGADLETGQVMRIPAMTYAPSSPGDEPARETAPHGTVRRPDRRRSWLVAAAVVVVGVLLGVLVGMLVALDGDDEPEETIPDAPAFDASRYDDETDPIPVASLGATSTNTVAGEELSVARMVDGDLSTAWENDGQVNRHGLGEQIVVEFADAAWLESIVIGNGAQEDDARYLGDARLQRIRVTFDGGDAVEVTVNDLQGLQIVHLPDPVLTTGLRIEVLETYEGDTYRELGISELRFHGWVAEGEDAEIASERAAVDR